MVKIIIPGPPIAQKRPRFARLGNHVRTYSPQITEAGRFLLLASEQYRRAPMDGPLCLDVLFFFPRPKAHFRTGKNSSVRKPDAPHMHTSKPDLDNLVKFVKDCLNGLCWNDDKQVSVIHARKAYVNDGAPSTIININQLEDCG